MYHHTDKRRGNRPGKVLVLVALLLVVLLGMCALAIDIGWICVTKAQLQSSSDAGSLAAGTELLPGLGASAYRTPAQVKTLAEPQAVAYVAEHRAGEAASTYIEPARDIQFGTAKLNSATGVWSFTWGATPYNAVGVTTRRSNVGTTAGDGPLPLFFAPILGQNRSSLTATSVAVIMPAKGIRIPPESGIKSGLVPFAFLEDTWKKYWRARKYFESNNLTSADVNDSNAHVTYTDTGINSDGTTSPVTYNEPLFHRMNNLVPELLFDDQFGVTEPAIGDAANVTNTSDGILELRIYPLDSTAGNFGTVDIGSSGNSTADLKRQIEFGINEQDMIDLGQVSITPPLSLEGDTGISAGIKAALEAIVGQCRGILLYSTVAGTGNNTVYQIQQLVGSRIMYVRLTGGDKTLVIQPCNWSDPAAVPDYDDDVGEETTFFTNLILAR